MFHPMILLLLAAWQSVSEQDGLQLHSREIQGQPYQEYRVSGSVALPVEEIDKRFIERFLTVKDESIDRTIIEKNNERIIIYDKVKTPVGSDRDYVLQISRSYDAKTKTLKWEFKPTQPEHKPCEKCIRMTSIHGSWMFVGSEKGSKLQYTVYSDPGGSVPTGMVSSAQKDKALARARLMLNALERK